MKKILFVAEFPAPYRVDVIKGLCEKYQVEVFFEQQQDEKRDETWLNKTGVNCEILDNTKSIFNYFKKIIKLNEYDAVIIYNNTFKFSIILEIACKLRRKPFFVNCDGCNDIQEPNLVKRLLKNFLMRGATGYFASGKSAKEYFESFGADPEKIHFHNFTSLHEADIEKKLIDATEKLEIKKHLGMTEKFVVVSVGRHLYCKGFDVILEATKEFENSVGVYIIGGEPSFENKIFKEKYKLDNVHFIDFQNKENLKKYYLAADVFVLMTRGDTWGLVVNEAMAKGLPVVTTNKCVAGVELIENDINGYIINVDDVKALIYYVEKLRSDEEKRLQIAKNNINKMQNNTVEEISLRHIEVLEEFFNNGCDN